LLDQGAAAVATILGILKAGKIYVALEPSQPRDELQRLVADCEPGLILAETPHRDLGRALVGDAKRCLCVDTLDDSAGDTDPGLALAPDRLACLFYTSGTTGAPKGVVDCHRNVLHNVMRYTNSLGITVHDRLSLVQSCSFSGTASSLFAALLNGATLCPFDLHGEGVARMAAWIDREAISIFHCVPAIFEQMVTAGGAFDGLRIIRLEGDQVQRSHLALFQARFDERCLLVNGLATTETGLIRQYFVTRHSRLPDYIMPVGYAVEDMDVRLVDATGAPVRAGAIGEIAVSSRYLAQGYWRRPDLTEAAFQPDPETPDHRVYRTGDLGRMQPDGCIESFGRKDVQVKVRGIGVEVTRIERALCVLPTVAEAAAIVREDRPGVQRLVAYVVPTRPVPTVTDLRRHLASLLPGTLLPTRYEFLDAMPLDRNSKVARRLLPPPSRDRPPLATPFAAPSDPTAVIVAGSFADVLELDAVGLHDDFFELGGDSLLATELVQAIEARLGVELPLDLLYETPTVAAIAAALQQQTPVDAVVPLQAQGEGLPLFCLHNYAGDVAEYRELARLVGTEQPVYGLRYLPTQDGGRTPRVEDLAAVYAEAIRRVQPTGPYRLAGNCFGGTLAFATAQALRAEGEEVALLALIDTAFPAGPIGQLWRQLAVRRHWRRLAPLPAGTILRDVLGRLPRFAHWAVATARRHLRPVTGERAERVWAANHLAETRYRPRRYDRPVVLVCLGAPHNQLGWKRVARAGLRVVDLPGAPAEDDGTLPHLTRAPHVQDLAEALRSLLRETAGGVPGMRSGPR
jgi:amino acid adenylation domain-containing protein